MSDYKKHAVPVDLSILDRITEDEVAEWIVARLHQLRMEGTPMHVMDLHVWFRDYRNDPHYDTGWNGHAVGSCADYESIAGMVSELKHKIADNPREKAREKKRKARELLKEAESLDDVADALDNPQPEGGD